NHSATAGADVHATPATNTNPAITLNDSATRILLVQSLSHRTGINRKTIDVVALVVKKEGRRPCGRGVVKEDHAVDHISWPSGMAIPDEEFLFPCGPIVVRGVWSCPCTRLSRV